MNIIVNNKQPATIHRDSLIRGCVYSNVKCPENYFLKVSTSSYEGVANLSDGSLIPKTLTYTDGWFEVEVEVHIK